MLDWHIFHFSQYIYRQQEMHELSPLLSPVFAMFYALQITCVFMCICIPSDADINQSKCRYIQKQTKLF